NRAGGFGVRLLAKSGGCRERDQLLRRDDLGDRRAEAVEDDCADIELAGFEQRQHPARDVARFLERYAAPADIGQAVVNQPRVVAAQAVTPLAADRQDLDGLAGIVELADAAPIFIAEVIFWVERTLRIRFRRSFKLGMSFYRRRA